MATVRKTKVPSLRFKDEQGKSYPDWEGKKLRQIAKIYRGMGLSKSVIQSEGKFPCILYGELFTKYAETIRTVFSYTDSKTRATSQFGDILMPTSDVTPSGLATASALLVKGVQLGGDINIIRLNKKINPIFMSYLINFCKKAFMRLVTGTTVKHIYAKDIQHIIFSIPTSQKEQQKIAAFLSSVDTKIEQLNQKKALLERYKKGMMQKLFSQKIRFKDEQRKDFPDWEGRRLGEVAQFYSGGTPTTTNKQYYKGNIPFIKSGEIGLSITEQFISDEGLKNSSARTVKKGDILYALYGATSGEVAISKIDGAINQAVLCIRSHLSHYFIFFYLGHKKGTIVSTFLQGGQGNLSAGIIKSLKFNFPSLKEQQKIAAFLSSLDTKTELVAEQLKQAQTFKKGLLQQMFI